LSNQVKGLEILKENKSFLKLFKAAARVEVGKVGKVGWGGGLIPYTPMKVDEKQKQKMTLFDKICEI
jgi:hypothetical protein